VPIEISGRRRQNWAPAAALETNSPEVQRLVIGGNR
jgi:hypothetical protein